MTITAHMGSPPSVRPIERRDHALWKPLWDGYNAFYGRQGESALPDEITQSTWRRFFAAAEPVFALVAEEHGQLLGLVHYLHHRSTTSIEPVCYLQDLFTAPAERGRGIGRALIEAVYAQARSAGLKQVYWQTHVTNAAGRRLYDQLAAHGGFIVYDKDL